MSGLTDRRRHFGALLRAGIWGKWVGAVYSLAGFYVFFRDDIWHPKHQDSWLVISMIPHWSLAWWLFGGALIVCLWLFEASYRNANGLRSRIESLEAMVASTGMSIALHPEAIAEGGLKDEDGNFLRPTMSFFVRVQAGNQSLRNCQLKVRREDQSVEYFVSAPFALRALESKDLPIIRIRDEVNGKRAALLMLRVSNWNIMGAGAALLLGPACYVVKAYCDETPPASLRVELTATESNGVLTEWSLRARD